MKSGKGRLLITVTLLFLLLAGYSYAAKQNKVSYVEKFKTGKVDISVQELMVSDSGQSEAAPELIEANKDVSYMPRITNLSADCYVRARVNIVADGEHYQPLGIECIYGLSEDWIRKGDFFYYTKVLKRDMHTDIFKGIHIPEDWDYGDADGVAVEVAAEAIQSSNFIPDFSKALPWGAVMLSDVTSNSNGDGYEAEQVNVLTDLEITSAGRIECAASDLFDEFTAMMPGDTRSKTVRMKNATRGKLHISLKVSAGESELNRKMKLSISNGDEQLYDGTVEGVNRTGRVDLIGLEKGESGNIEFKLQLPTDTDNNYAEISDDMVWELEAEAIDDKGIQTGDLVNLLPFAAVALLSAMTALYMLIHRKRGE